MSFLESSAKYLSEKGLNVEVLSPDKLRVQWEADRLVDVSTTDAGYRVSSWECTPGPGEDDFLIVVPSLDDTLLIVWCYYFAKNIQLSGWDVPLHRRPGWSLAKLQYRLMNASYVSASQFEIVRETRRQSEPVGVESIWAYAERTQFIAAGRHCKSGDTFLLRRDMEEGYVVSGY